MRIYLDNAATTALDDEVLAEMLPYMKSHFGNPSSIHADGRTSRAAIEKARRRIAINIGSSIGEIFFTSGGTEANNMALKCAVRDLKVQRIISSPIEHQCILHTLDTLKKYHGVEVVLLPVDKKGRIALEDLQEVIQNSEKKTMVSLMYANNEIGTVHHFEKIATICKDKGVFFHSDTVQAMGQFPINVSTTPVNFLVGSAHKFHGPKGVGFIYINGDNQVNPYIDGGAQERNMRGGTENLYGIVGMSKALDLACAQMDERQQHIIALRNHMIEALKTHFEGVLINGCEENYLPKVLSVSLPPSANGEMLLMLLDIAGVSASGGSACSSGVEHESHVLVAINGNQTYKTIRFSFSYHNTKQEIDLVIQKMKEING